MTQDWSRQLHFEDVEVGQEVPPTVTPITLQRLVMEAAADRDFVPLHHDGGYARAGGAPDAFANGMFIRLLFEMTLRNWMGLEGRLRRLGFRMLTHNYVGTIVTCRGWVIDKHTKDGEGRVELDVWYESDRDGQTITTVRGSATVSLPLRAPKCRETSRALT